MKYNKEHFGTDFYMFLDDTTNEDYDKVKRLAGLEKDLGFPIKWVGYCRADLIWAKPESAEHLAQSGLVSPHFGIESFHPKASQFINKGWSGKKGKEWLPKLYHDIWKGKLNLRLNFITGLPHEPLADIENYIKWWNADPLGNIFFSVLSLHPKRRDGGDDNRSELSKNAEELGFVLSDRTMDGMISWTSPWGSSQEATVAANNAISRTFNKCRPSSWNLAGGLNLGYTLEEAMNTRGSEILDPGNVRVLDLKRRYLTQFSKHFNLPHLLPGDKLKLPK